MVKSKKAVQIIFVVLIAIVFITTSVFIFCNETYTWEKLVSESDYVVTVTRETLRCEEKNGLYVMSSYKGKQAYTQNGKVYTEVYIPLCSCDDFLGDKITIVTDNKYITDSKAYYTLFLKCIDKEKGIYEPINGRTGIIKWKQSKISNTVHCHPLDPGLYNKDIAECFQKYAYEDTNHYCSQNELQYHIEK